ncbi:hypothetical protein D9758_001861 [Tetrapyrgos nigripes]|uniref:GH16 domain-containing protein n=1 Tax=Tetrapyrgos nigripes TaxID=182062 RepID=A0A8H5GT94_9AGAR|nr:hypothetical protein D9758_001861 [Tetrapyrgos nigripes]
MFSIPYGPFVLLSFSFLPIVIAQQQPQVFQIPPVIPPVLHALQCEYRGHDFLSWIWNTFDDPTHGRVNYIDKATALASNLTFASDDKFIMRTDSTSFVPSASRGRNSNRIQSPDAFGNSILVLDVQHMPTGCATWPAFWTVSQGGPWPTGGEIDIIEGQFMYFLFSFYVTQGFIGVNLNTMNLASLHTLPQCAMPPIRAQTGQTVSTDCDSAVNYNQGCGVSSSNPRSYGPGFNACGGGWYVMERSDIGVKIWFFSRCEVASVPLEVQSLYSPTISTLAWPQPDAFFPFGENCSYNDHFDPHSIIFDTTLCGDWAGTAFATSGCGAAQCSDYVDQNPGAFVDSFWEINYLRVYLPS